LSRDDNSAGARDAIRGSSRLLSTPPTTLRCPGARMVLSVILLSALSAGTWPFLLSDLSISGLISYQPGIWRSSTPPAALRCPGARSSEHGTYKTVKIRFWPRLSAESPPNLLRCSLFAPRSRLLHFVFQVRSRAVAFSIQSVAHRGKSREWNVSGQKWNLRYF